MKFFKTVATSLALIFGLGSAGVVTAEKWYSGESYEEQLWNFATDSDVAEAYRAYLTEFPNGEYASIAREKLALLAASGVSIVEKATLLTKVSGSAIGDQSASVDRSFQLAYAN